MSSGGGLMNIVYIIILIWVIIEIGMPLMKQMLNEFKSAFSFNTMRSYRSVSYM